MHPIQEAAPIKAGVDIRLNGALLTVSFHIESSRPVYANPQLPSDSPQWGLWDWDVVELFLSCDGKAPTSPYYEFQISPLGQHFELEILEPRKRVNRDFRSGFSYSAKQSSQGSWEARFEIPLNQLAWDLKPSSIVGNAFAILGPPEARTYWSLFLGAQETPDFHLPKEFRPLI